MKKSLIFLILILSLTVKCLFADSVVVADAQVKELPDEQFQLCIRSTGPQPFDVIEAETKDVEILLYQASLGEVDAIITAAFGSIEFREKPEGRVWVGIDFSGNKFAAKVSQGVDGQSVDVRVFVSTDEQGPVISDLKSVNVTSAGALIAWMTDEPSDGTVVIELNGEVVANIAEKNVPATEHSVLVESLEAETVYSYYVISEDGQGNRSESSRGAFETLPGQLEINFNDYILRSVIGQDQNKNQFQILDDGRTLRLYGNNIKAIDINVEILSDAVLSFDFKSTGAVGEINAVAFAPDLNLVPSQNRMFQVFGTQKWAKYQNFAYTAVGEWQHFEIPVGQFYTGNFAKMFFANDADLGQNTNVYYRNVTIGEPTPINPAPIVTADAVPGFVKDSELLIQGTKSAGSSVWLDNQEIVSINDNLIWSYEVSLSGDGPHTMVIHSENSNQEKSANVTLNTILDASAPQGEVLINDGAVSTTSVNVTLSISQTETNPDKMRVFVENTDILGWIDFQTTLPVELPGGNGEKVVKVEFMDKAGNLSVADISDTIVLEDLPAGDNYLDFTQNQLVSIIGQDIHRNQYDILDDGRTLRMYGNNAKAVQVDAEIHANSVISFDFKSIGAVGEINAVAFAPNLNLPSGQNQMFQVFGSQKWGKYQGFAYTAGGDWQHFEIRAGTFFTGNYKYLYLVNDADAGQNTNVQYRNIQIN